MIVQCVTRSCSMLAPMDCLQWLFPPGIFILQHCRLHHNLRHHGHNGQGAAGGPRCGARHPPCARLHGVPHVTGRHARGALLVHTRCQRHGTQQRCGPAAEPGVRGGYTVLWTCVWFVCAGAFLRRCLVLCFCRTRVCCSSVADGLGTLLRGWGCAACFSCLQPASHARHARAIPNPISVWGSADYANLRPPAFIALHLTIRPRPTLDPPGPVAWALCAIPASHAPSPLLRFGSR